MCPRKKSALPGAQTDSNLDASFLHEQLETLSRSIRSLYHASEEIQYSKPLPTLLKSILKGLKSATGISRAAIFLFDPPEETLTPQLQGCVSIVFSDAKVTGITIPLEVDEEDTLLFIHPYSNREVSSSACYQRLTTLLKELLELRHPQMQVLEIRDQLVGLMVFEQPEDPFSVQEVVVLFSRQAALTIDNARMFAKVEEMALRDTLTGLYNRRYIHQLLEYEINRARRYRQPLSLMFIDLDHFKQVNDTYGHAMGDRLLKQMAKKLSGLFRTTDVVGRYAGDEFLAILPSTPTTGAAILAERVQNVIGRYEVMCRGKTLTISVSIGLSTYEGEEGVGTSTLIDRADQAMYQAKSSGRNCVRFHNEKEILSNR
jgi:diguanylate cyclase (GGDEF)-like protein